MRIPLLLLLFCFTFYKADAQNYSETIKKANSLYQSKDYNKSLALYEEAFKINTDEYVDIYNAACTAALANIPSKAFKYLNEAIDGGWTNVDHLKKDTDLESLHNNKNWTELFNKIQLKIDLKNLVPYRIKDKWGYSNSKGKLFIPAKYDSVNFFNEDNFFNKYVAINIINKKYCLISNDDKVIIPAQYEKLELIHKGLLIAKNKTKYGIINSKNKIVVPMIYDSIAENYEYSKNSSKEYYYLSKIGKDYFIIDAQFSVKKINKTDYDSKNHEYVMGYFPDDLKKLENEKWDYIKQNKRQIIENNKTEIDSFSTKPYEIWGAFSNLVKIYKNGKSGFVEIDELLKYKIEKLIVPQYDTIIDIRFDEPAMIPRFFLAKNGNKITVVDFNNNVLLPPIYEDYSKLGYRNIFIKDKGKYGYFDLETGTEIKPKYDFLKYSYDDLLKVKLKGKWGYINTTGFEYFKD
ncbi:WG repeat-containing protein [Flavobacterium luteolum]|uniref:WG repeat-containing protein n=1 Tax=Flavobacterium luteolum TaxID=3003259 RepID=UPI00248EAE2D|nr:WG repeat-containing protein [Flavobacterium luteolum]